MFKQQAMKVFNLNDNKSLYSTKGLHVKLHATIIKTFSTLRLRSFGKYCTIMLTNIWSNHNNSKQQHFPYDWMQIDKNVS